MKKLLLAVFALTSVAAMAETHVYGKLGADVWTKYSAVKAEGETIFSSNRGRGVGIFLEATQDVLPNTELGLGIGYIRRANGKSKNTDGVKYGTPRYSSVPLYMIAKYNFDINSNIRPYVKADLGYSFNKMNKNVIKEDKKVVGKFKAKNGLYAGVAVGAEYNNFLTELAFHHTKSNISASEGKGKKPKYSNNSVSLSVGYKFDF